MKMTICVKCDCPDHQMFKERGDDAVFVNEYSPDAKWVIDHSCIPGSDLAKMFPKSKRAYFAGEPTPYMSFDRFPPRFFDEFYAMVFAWHKDLEGLRCFRKFSCGGSWVSWNPKPLDFGISGIFSGKHGLPGYTVRRRIEFLEEKIQVPSMVYGPRGSWKGESYSYPLPGKEDALSMMFHWAIENISEPGWFTEKIIDCFVCGCVPVYYGDPRIGDTFDERGIIKLDESDIAGQANSLTPGLYEEMMPFIKGNQVRAQAYRHMIPRAIRCIKEATK